MPAGDELNTAVAQALGLTRKERHGFWRDADGAIQPDPYHSTDPKRIPEMLAWLNERGWYLDLSQNTSDVVDGVWECEAWREAHCYPWSRTEGDTIQHALANLVVSVGQHAEGS